MPSASASGASAENEPPLANAVNVVLAARAGDRERDRREIALGGPGDAFEVRHRVAGDGVGGGQLEMRRADVEPERPRLAHPEVARGVGLRRAHGPCAVAERGMAAVNAPLSALPARADAAASPVAVAPRKKSIVTVLASLGSSPATPETSCGFSAAGSSSRTVGAACAGAAATSIAPTRAKTHDPLIVSAYGDCPRRDLDGRTEYRAGGVRLRK